MSLEETRHCLFVYHGLALAGFTFCLENLALLSTDNGLTLLTFTCSSLGDGIPLAAWEAWAVWAPWEEGMMTLAEAASAACSALVWVALGVAAPWEVWIDSSQLKQ